MEYYRTMNKRKDTMTTLEEKYKNLTPLEKYVYDQFHNEIEDSGCEITNLGVEQIANESYSINKIKGGLGSLIKKGLMNNEGKDGSGYESFTVNLYVPIDEQHFHLQSRNDKPIKTI